MRRIGVGLPLLAAAALASCGQSPVDGERGEQLIRGVVAEQVGARVAAVSCPDEAERKSDSFTCAVTGVDGSRGEAIVRRGEGGGFSVDAPFLHVREAETAMTEQIERRVRSRDVEVACPEIVVVEEGALFRCKATAAGRARAVTARLIGEQGRFRFRLG